jgi:hypothetical protein
LIEVRDGFLRRVGVVEQYTSVQVISRFNGVGSWTLTVPADSREAELLQPGGGIIVWVDGVPRPVMSGPMSSVTHSWDADQSGAGQIVYTGLSDETLLWSRVTLPVPGAPINAQTTDRYSVAGAASLVLAELVNVNAGPNARLDRVIPQLQVSSVALGASVNVSTRFDVLGTKLAEVAASVGIGWRLRQGATDTLLFEPFVPRVHDSGQVTFSPSAGNLAAYRYRISAPTATRAVVAAQGEGRARWLAEYDSTPTGYEWARTPIERFVDRRDIPVARGANGSPVNPDDPSQPADPQALAELDQGAAEALAESRELGELSVTPIDSDMFKYGANYDVGDVVTVDIRGNVITDVLREVQLSDGNDGPRVTPVIGTDGATATPGLYREVRRIWNSIRKLEARR